MCCTDHRCITMKYDQLCRMGLATQLSNNCGHSETDDNDNLSGSGEEIDHFNGLSLGPSLHILRHSQKFGFDINGIIQIYRLLVALTKITTTTY